MEKKPEKKFSRIKCPVCNAMFKIEDGALEATCKFCGSAFELDGEGRVTGGAFVGQGIGPEAKGVKKEADAQENSASEEPAHKMPETVSYTSDELEDPEFKEQTKHMGVAFKNIAAGAIGVLLTCLIVLGMLTLMTGLAGK